MCGIVGYVDTTLGATEGQALLADMTEVIRHRGPDDDGFWCDEGVGLGMRRLSIIDVWGGRQPMTNEDGAVVVVFNGEIYNFPDLRRELEATGHQFRTRSDTETIAHAYEEDGVDFVQRLRGMFAIALWDRQRKRLLLTRDRFGKKPLHYYFDGTRLLFGSEIKSLLLSPHVSRELDIEALNQYFAFGYIPAPRTILAGIRKLPPAHTLCFEDGQVSLRRYWQLSFAARCTDDEETAARRLRELLAEAVRLRLISDVPLGAFLSGGVDSSAVVGLMSTVAPERVKTFSVGFEEQDYSELEYARLVAQRYATEHHEFIVKLDVLETLPQLVWDFDEPFADASMVPTYCVSKLARQFVTVALSGDGGDELFGGYSFYAQMLGERRLRQRLGPLCQLAGVAGAMLPARARGKNRLRGLAMGMEARASEAPSIFPTPLRQRLIQPEYRVGIEGEPARVKVGHFAEVADLDLLTRLQHVDVECYLPDDILVKVDKASMFASLETRAPLLDHVLAEYVASLPGQIRNPEGQLKALFKRAVRDLLPAENLTRPKMGFGLPVEHWLRGPLREYAQDVLGSQRARGRGVLDMRLVEQLLRDHQRHRANHASQLWACLCFELWCRTYLDAPGVSAAPLENRLTDRMLSGVLP
jgi:asparagine synthase (glutamine-hydrolysing)